VSSDVAGAGATGASNPNTGTATGTIAETAVLEELVGAALKLDEEPGAGARLSYDVPEEEFTSSATLSALLEGLEYEILEPVL
jgi:hypothetical protein